MQASFDVQDLIDGGNKEIHVAAEFEGIVSDEEAEEILTASLMDELRREAEKFVKFHKSNLTIVEDRSTL